MVYSASSGSPFRHPAAVGAGAVGLGLSGIGRFGSMAWAQEASPAASGLRSGSLLPAVCRCGAVQYEKLADLQQHRALQLPSAMSGAPR